MNNFERQPKFETKPIIEQKPFENPAVQSFFKKWCEINDSIEPVVYHSFVKGRERLTNILEKRPDGKQNLYIPDDLQLWEMVEVMEAVDRDTFKKKPERQTEKVEKIFELGKTFRNAGVYIAKRLNSIGQGKEIAGALAEEFYNYGESLIHREKAKKEVSMKEIASENLSSKDTKIIDRWLAGDELYESRQKRVEKSTEADSEEAERQKTLAQFFRIAQKAFELEQKSGVRSDFLRKIERAMQKQIETPKRELAGSIFRRGMELLQRNMPFDTLPDWVKSSCLHWQDGEKTLREALRTDQLKSELKKVRQSGDVVKIDNKEREIANRIQLAVSNFTFKPSANNPSEIVVNSTINCVGASMLGGALMREVGLNYLVGDVPEHSILFLVTSDGHVEWRDMLNSQFNENLTDEMIVGNKKDGSPITVTDIIAFSQKPKPEGLMLDIKSEKYRDKLPWVKEGQRQYITLFEPEYGQKIQVLNNTGEVLSSLGHNEEAIEAYRQVITLDPKFAYPYNNLGNALGRLGRNEEAIKSYREAIALDPEYNNPHYNLGIAFRNLGRNEEAIKEYQKYIELSDKQKDAYWIERVEKIIAKLENKK
ncbi:MAG: tetratricopeptide repeat protein [bacterium]|nr:tetratricopeptide repeat protein [bacterium]